MQFNPSKYQQAGRSVFMSSVTGLANTVAGVVTFVGAPPLYSKTIDWVQRFTATHYGHGWADLTSLAWFVVCLCLVFFISRASISTALVMGGLAIATRFI
ncbi:MAG: hypothetical protein AAF724_14930 [Pseudomonadota bacterium]